MPPIAAADMPVPTVVCGQDAGWEHGRSQCDPDSDIYLGNDGQSADVVRRFGRTGRTGGLDIVVTAFRAMRHVYARNASVC